MNKGTKYTSNFMDSRGIGTLTSENDIIEVVISDSGSGGYEMDADVDVLSAAVEESRIVRARYNTTHGCSIFYAVYGGSGVPYGYMNGSRCVLFVSADLSTDTPVLTMFLAMKLRGRTVITRYPVVSDATI